MSLRDMLLLAVAVTWSGAGHILLRLGMRHVGALYLAILSRTPVTVALPATALICPVTALLAWPVLGEVPTASQWAGTGLVMAGVVLIARL